MLLLLAGCRADVPVEQPVVLGEEAAFEFPLELWDQGAEGETIVRLRVNASGVVDSAFVYESSGEPAFDEAAIAGAVQLRFDPATQGGRTVDAWVRLPVRFSRDGDALVRTGSPELVGEPGAGDGAGAGAQPSSPSPAATDGG